LMQGLVLDRPAADVARAAFERGVVVGTAGPDVLRLLPPYVVTEAELDRGLGLLADALAHP
ncbi:MAG TPA: aspartate aminotransferase family protein, partial [Planctomycetota bacterium]|nr:aspartate aminotransferase family protein [Planctomycetota bacterium]